MLPTPYTVGLERFVPGATNAHGAPRDEWLPAVDLLVHGWAPPGSDKEPFEAGRTPVIRDLDVYAPAGTVVASKDKVTLPGVGVFKVVGHEEDYTKGPWQWAAGVRVNLLRVEG